MTRQLDRKRAPRLEDVRVTDAMHAGVVTCAAATSLRDVAWLLTEHQHIHCVAVPPNEGRGAKPWGIVSDLDIIAAAAAGSVEATAGEIATDAALTISDDDALDRAADLMTTEHRVAHLVVLGATGRPVGILSSLDVAGVLAWRAQG